MKVAVIGSNSFSGSHMVARLLSDGAEVLGVSRSSEVQGAFNPYSHLCVSSRWHFVQADIRDSTRIADTLHDFRPDFVVNFAAQSMVAQSWDSPEDWYQTNVVALAKFSRILSDLSGLERYVHVTTPEVYGSMITPRAEGAPFSPTTPYAISRAAGDWHLMAMFEVMGLPVSFTRAANVYGPGQSLYRLIPRALLSARTGRVMTLDGGGTSVRSFVHIRDVADATHRVLINGQPGSTYHISTDKFVTIRELVEQIAELSSTPFKDFVRLGDERPGKDHAYLLDASKISEELQWIPSIVLEEGLKQTLSWVDGNLEELKQSSPSYEHRR